MNDIRANRYSKEERMRRRRRKLSLRRFHRLMVLVLCIAVVAVFCAALQDVRTLSAAAEGVSDTTGVSSTLRTADTTTDGESTFQTDTPSITDTAVTAVVDAPLIQAGATLFDDYYADYTFDEKIEALRILFPDGAYWNSCGTNTDSMTMEEAAMVTTETPCAHSVNGYAYCNTYDGATRSEFPYASNIQCLGFASMVSDFLFGQDAAVSVFYDYDSLKPGDHIRFLYAEHSVIVLEKTDDFIRVLECNGDYENCEICWDREISRSEMEEYGAEFLTRN